MTQMNTLEAFFGVTPKNTFTWSDEQNSILDWFKHGKGNLVVRARAGTAKTTTAVEGANTAPEDTILMAAFSKVIAGELKARLDNPCVSARTLHSLGNLILKRNLPAAKMSDNRAKDLSKRACGQGTPWRVIVLVAKLHTLLRETYPLGNELSRVFEIMDSFDIEPEPEDRLKGWTRERVARTALDARELAKDSDLLLRTGYDFTDMIFQPVVHPLWCRPSYDLVIIDEAQDMNKTQISLALSVARDRIAVFGDDKQAIFGFRGADSGSLDRLKGELEAREMPLTTTYRCAQAIVREARYYVPEFNPGPDNPSGRVYAVSTAAPLIQQAKAGDAVLSRTNAPLVKHCLAAIKEGIPAMIQGRDVGQMLIALVQKIAKGSDCRTIREFLVALEDWRARELDALDKEDVSYDSRASLIMDKSEALHYLLDPDDSVEGIVAKLKQMFAVQDPAQCITFSTVHKAKGLEWNRVFIITETFCFHGPEEDNIRYVAITRAKSELVWYGKPFTRRGRLD